MDFLIGPLLNWLIANAFSVASVLVQVIATFAVVYSVLALRNQLRLQVFLEYTRRFDEIEFPEGAFVEPWPRLTKKRARKAERAFRKYFDLCSQEWWLHQSGKIESRVWEVWARGMADIVATAGGRHAWQTIRPEYQNVFPGFASFIDEFLVSK